MRFAASSQRLIRAFVALGLVALPAAANAGESASVPIGRNWNPWVEFGGLGADDDHSRALIELWAPLMQGPSALLFFDGRFQFIEQSTQEGNAQFGLRKMTPSGWNLGAWISGDVRETSVDNTFWQVAGGLEALSVKWDLRVNGYLPVTDPKVSPELAQVKLKGNSIFMIGGEEVPLYGVNGEIGYLLFGSPETKQGMRHELRVYGGGFWFDHSDAIDEVAGPSARVEWRIDDLIPDWGGSRLTFDAGYSHDDVRDDLWEVGARLRIPLGGTKTYALLSPQSRRMQERIERDDDIITVQSGPEKVLDVLTDVRFDRVAYVGSSITTTSAKAGDNSLLIAKGGTIAGPQVLQGNQTLQGGGSTIQVRGVKSGVVADFTAPGSRPTINGIAGTPDLTLAGNNMHVVGFDMVEGMRGVVAGDNHRNIVLEQLNLFNIDDDGILFNDNNRDVTIKHVTISTDVNGDGIQINNGNRNIRIYDVTLNNVVNTGIQFGSNNSDVTIDGATLTQIGAGGISFLDNNRDIGIFNVAMSGVVGNGINFGSNNWASIAQTEVSNTSGIGINFGSNNWASIAETEVSNTGGAGINFGSANWARIAETEVSNTGGAGINFGSDNRASIAETEVSNTGGAGINFGSNNTVNMAYTEVSNTDARGINFGGNNTVNIADTEISDTNVEGIGLTNDNTVSIADTEIRNAGRDGISFGSDNTVNIADTEISNAARDGISFVDGNMVTIADTEIGNAGRDGLRFSGNNTVSLNNSTFSGNFGDDVIDIDDAPNTLSGGGNVFDGTVGGQFCEAAAGQTGSFAFDQPSATCP